MARTTSHQAEGALLSCRNGLCLPRGASALPSPCLDAARSSLRPGLRDPCRGTDSVHPTPTGSDPPGLTHFYVPLSPQGSCHAVFLWPGDPVRGQSQPWGPLQQEENLPFVEQGGRLPGRRLAWHIQLWQAGGQSSSWDSCGHPFSVHSAPRAPQYCSLPTSHRHPVPAPPSNLCRMKHPSKFLWTQSLMGGRLARVPAALPAFWLLQPSHPVSSPISHCSGRPGCTTCSLQSLGSLPRGAAQAGHPAGRGAVSSAATDGLDPAAFLQGHHDGMISDPETQKFSGLAFGRL